MDFKLSSAIYVIQIIELQNRIVILNYRKMLRLIGASNSIELRLFTFYRHEMGLD